MSRPAADRNLLFGILALQMDFISRDALLAAMSAWALAKDKPLGQVLADQGALRPDNRVLLDALVARHLQMHANDPQRSLAALSSIGPLRHDLQEINDADVQASLAHASASRPQEDGATTGYTATSLPAGTRFQILRPHARGGLGEVFVARDTEVDREVALKEIQQRHAGHPDNRARFLLEAQVTGALEHPGIVPVYGLGTYADGRPFYAMRFIQGDSLKDAIAAFHAADRAGQPASERALALRGLLGRFIDVCNAIAYAHSRGVLHRDLKPGNVMLGKYGETLVVDWGLAKVLGKAETEATEGVVVSSADSGLTQAGKALGTPAYMSPEQARGQLDKLGPRSDVYSLGATLYCLLTGQPPFTETDVGTVLARVQKGDFAPARQINPRVPVALEAVCLEAMALAPEDRYGGPQELAEEIEHWLADEPVRAYREPWRLRAARWRRRHPALVTGTAALLFTGLLAVAVGGLLVGREQQARLEQQRKARQAQVNTLLDAAPQAVPAILEALQPHHDEIRPLLRQVADDPEPREVTAEVLRLWRQHRARAALALLPGDLQQVGPLTARLLEEGLDPAEMLLVRDALQPHAAQLKSDLWRRADEGGPDSRFRALVALAAFDPGSSRWEQAADAVLRELLRANPLHLGLWVQALRPVRERLLPPLGRVFRGEDLKLAEYRQVAASVLADHAADRPDVLSELLLDADARQYAVLKPVLMRYREQATARMSEELARLPDFWKDAPLDPGWKEPAAGLRREVEQAGGLFAERFALCQALPLARLEGVTEGLRQAGYRPLRVRPWQDGAAVRVAVVWMRDGRDWRLQTGLSGEQVGLLGGGVVGQAASLFLGACGQAGLLTLREGLVPADVAGYRTKEGDRYVLLWRKGDKGEQAVAHTGLTEADYRVLADSYRKDGHSPATLQALRGPDGVLRCCGVWWKGGTKPAAWNVILSDDPKTYDDRVQAGEQLLVDVSVGAGGEPFARAAQVVAAPGLPAARELLAGAGALRRYGSVWQEEDKREAAGLHGLTATEHLARCRELAGQGYRPMALSLGLAAGEKEAVAASVWHRPALSAAEQERSAQRQATAAATLLQLGHAEPAWPLWRHSPDPTVRSYLVERVASRGVDPRLLVRRLLQEKDTSARQALIVALGDYKESELPAQERGPLVKQLLLWYRDDPDAGIHGAIDWLLRHGKEGPVARPLDWGQSKELARIDRDLASRGHEPPEKTARRWYVNSQGQTFTLIKGPVEVRMGSPLTEPNRNAVTEKPYVREILRSYALQTKAVTVAQYERFLAERPQYRYPYMKRYSPEGEGPIIAVTWYDAAAYCNWLSEKEGVPQDQWCYPEKIGEGMRPYPDHLRRTGYRLPSEAEWEYACRAGSATSRYYGSSVDMLPRYAWHIGNSFDRAWPVGQKRPNDLGLFDMHGNVWTWCADPALLDRSGRVEDKEDVRDNSYRFSRVLRGASFVTLAPDLRSAYRIIDRPAGRNSTFGLRLCRTYH